MTIIYAHSLGGKRTLSFWTIKEAFEYIEREDIREFEMLHGCFVPSIAR